YPVVDLQREIDGVTAKMAPIHSDPNRSACLALLRYADGEKRYILAPEGLAVEDTVLSGPDAEVRPGNAMPLRGIPIGTKIHNIEMAPKRGGQMVRAAGTSAQVMAKEGDYAHVRLPSGEVRLLRLDCRATIGQVSNLEHDPVTPWTPRQPRLLRARPGVRCGAIDRE